MPSRCATLGAIAGFATANPHSPALLDTNGFAMSYAELWGRIEAIGSKLREAGIGPRDTVAILVPQGVCEVVAVAGVLNYCICAPLQQRTNITEVEAALGKLAASALIVTPEFEVEAQAASALGLTVLIARKEEFPKDWETRSPASRRKPRSTNSEAIMLLVTSATTANAKVVPLTAANLNAGCVARCDSLQLTASDRMLLMTSLSHSIGIGTTLSQFLVGGSVIATGGFDSSAYLRWLNDLRPTWYDCAPTVHQAALGQLLQTAPQMPLSLRFIQSAGAPLPGRTRQELEQLLRIPVFNDYGMTEACAIATDAFPLHGRVPNSAGRSCGMQIGIMSTWGQLLPAGDEGEIVVRGAAVFPGYEGDAEATRRAFQDGWFKTGDLGRLDEDENLFVTGRLREMINRGGEKIMPSEVDAALVSHPAVLEAAAFAVPHPTLGEDVACAVVLRRDRESQVSAQELRRYASERLAAFKAPRRIYFVEEIPRGELGKPQRWLLTEQFKAQGTQFPAPEDVTVRRLAYDVDDVFYKLHEIWARLLDRNDLGFDEDFFEAGGDSLGAITMLAEVDERFGSETGASAASFLDEPTLEHLTDLVGTARPSRPSGASSELQVIPVHEGGSKARLFCVPSDQEEGLYFRRLAAHLLGEMDLSIVRPANTLYSWDLFTFERAGQEMATLIRRVQPEGPYHVAGYCYGGMVAVEAARQLVLTGQDVRLILFDVPRPDWPPLLRYAPYWLERAGREWKLLQAQGAGRSLASRLAWAKAIAGVFARRALWSAITTVRHLIAPLERISLLQKLISWAQAGNLPFYRARTIEAPILHFLCADEPRAEVVEMRSGWREVAHRGIVERQVGHDHPNTLHESNLPGIVHAILEWREVQSKPDASLVQQST